MLLVSPFFNFVLGWVCSFLVFFLGFCLLWFGVLVFCGLCGYEV